MPKYTFNIAFDKKPVGTIVIHAKNEDMAYEDAAQGITDRTDFKLVKEEK